MTGRLALGAMLALAVAACGSAPPSPSPVPTPESTWDPRRDEIDQAANAWAAEQPGTYAYTTTNQVQGMRAATSHVTVIDGHTEQLDDTNGFISAGELTIEDGFDLARAGLSGDGKLTIAVDQQYGYLSSIEYATTVADGSYTRTVSGFTTPGDRTANARAREALDAYLDRWQGLATPAWEYTWTRVDALSLDAPKGFSVRHADGVTMAAAAGGSAAIETPTEATVGGTVADAVGVMGAGGWVDVSADDLTGLDALIAVDPSPTAKGDGYWIRIDFTDRAAARQREHLDAARARWASAKIRKSTYRWAYDGADGAYGWTIAANGDVLRFVKRSKGAPTGESMFVRPSIPDAFTMIDEILSSGGTVSVRYDKALGYPRKIVIANGGTAAPAGAITISGFKTP